MVLELLEGSRALSEVLSAERQLEDRLHLLLQVAEAVAHAHSKGVVHRDLKPENVLVDEAGRARVTDFGLAWHDGADSLTATGATLGTPLYMAPEQAQGLGTSTRSDVYALAAVFYEMVCGRPVIPLKRPSAHACIAYLESQKPLPAVPLKVLVPNTIPPGLERLVLDCLDRHPARRADDAMDLEARARRYLVTNNEPIGPSRRRGIHRILGALFGRREKQGGGFRRNE